MFTPRAAPLLVTGFRLFPWPFTATSSTTAGPVAGAAGTGRLTPTTCRVILLQPRPTLPAHDPFMSSAFIYRITRRPFMPIHRLMTRSISDASRSSTRATSNTSMCAYRTDCTVLVSTLMILNRIIILPDPRLCHRTLASLGPFRLWPPLFSAGRWLTRWY